MAVVHLARTASDAPVAVAPPLAAAAPSGPTPPISQPRASAAWVRRVRPGWARAAGAAVAGAVLTLSFAPYGIWPAAVVVVAALALLTRGLGARQGAGVGLAAGLGFFLPLLHWTGVYVGPVPWTVLGVFQALYLVPLGAASALVQRLRGWPLWLAAVWVADEALRMRWPYGGFPWGRLAFGQSDAPTLGLSAVGGAPLVSFGVALAGTLLAAVARAVVRRRLAGAVLGVAAVAAVLFAGTFVPAPAATGPTVTVAVVQGDVPRLGLDFNAQRAAVLGNHARATHRLAARVRAGTVPRPDLVIWPENSSDIDPYADPAAAATIDSAVRDIGVPVLVGAVVGVDARHVDNTGIVWSPTTGPGATYVKRHPVPFAEYIPMRRVARLFSKEVDRVSRDFAQGTRPGVLRVGPATVGDVICFEVGYDGLVRDVVRGGGQVIAVQTNNATFGFTPQTEQQLAMSRLRAVEHARTVLVSATSGVSAVIAPDGHLRERSRIFTAATFVDRVPLSDARTIADRVGGWPELALVLLAVGAVLSAAAGARRRPDQT